MKFNVLILSFLFGGALAAGCTPHQVRDEAPIVIEVPQTWSSLGVSDTGRGFCGDFDDPYLRGLIDQALGDNLSLQAAWSRVEQAELGAELAGGSRYPQANLQFSGTRAESALPPSIDLGPMTPETSAYTVWNMSVPVSYELDLWGRLRSQRQAAELDAIAARAQTEAMAISIAAQVTELYFNIVFQHELRALVDQQIAVAEQMMQTSILRFTHGQATAPDVLMQRTQIEGLRAQLEQIAAAEMQNRLRLATLLGQGDAGAITTSETLPDVPALPDLGIPADLLSSRPDVYAAEVRWRAQDNRVAVAVADRLPAVRLTAALSFQSANLGDLLDDVFWSAMGAITQPIFGGGRLDLNVDMAEVRLDEQALTYGHTLLTAMHEVEEALVLESHQSAYLDQLAVQQATATQSLEQEESRYRLGGSAFLRVLTAQSTLYGLEQSTLQSERQALSYRVQLCRALGTSSPAEERRAAVPPEDETTPVLGGAVTQTSGGHDV